jgi:hypothetical protein
MVTLTTYRPHSLVNYIAIEMASFGIPAKLQVLHWRAQHHLLVAEASRYFQILAG